MSDAAKDELKKKWTQYTIKQPILSKQSTISDSAHNSDSLYADNNSAADESYDDDSDTTEVAKFNDANKLNVQIKDSNIDLEAIETLLFPHLEIREIQDVLIKKIDECVAGRKNLIAHAPTGLGKTAAALSPALTHVIKNNKNNNNNLTIFFLTSRHTQHKIVLDTLKKINEKFNLKIIGNSIIGKKHLCLQPSVEKMHSKEFAEFCRLLVDNSKCDYYNHLKSKARLSPDTEVILSNLRARAVSSAENIVKESSARSICPYEISLLLAKDAKVIIADYQYLFNSHIRDNFFKKLNKELADSIIIIDEAHNLPSRIKDLSSEFLSNITLKRAITEARKFNYDNVVDILERITDIIEGYVSGLNAEEHSKFQKNAASLNVTLDNFSSAKDYKFFEANEKYITKEQFIAVINTIKDYDELVSELVFTANAIREQQDMSYIGSVAMFLEAWVGQDAGFTRIVSVKKLRDKSEMITLGYRCLDPSIIAEPVISKAYSCILMSGTLTPTSMYKELLGIEADELTLKSPFPVENRLNLVIPKTSTKYEMRSPEQYREIGKTLADITSDVKGSVAIYFPSYYLMEEISKQFVTLTKKTVFTERPEMSKQEKQEFLDTFVKYKDSGAVLLAVISGSFSEGIDLPGVLKMVIIVGLPLQKPDLETKALIEYYDKKFSKGWDYGYLFPAFTKAIQAAGRCIRNEHDKGIIVFLDERYSWNNYYRCFPQTWPIKISLIYKDTIRRFFEN
jgi:DNA excision repair protein ERCC-2